MSQFPRIESKFKYIIQFIFKWIYQQLTEKNEQIKQNEKKKNWENKKNSKLIQNNVINKNS